MNRVLTITAVLLLVLMMVSCGEDGGEIGDAGDPCTESDMFCHSYAGLNWSDVSSAEMSQDDARSYCLNIGGRLPTISEFRTLVVNCSSTVEGGSCKVTDDCLSYAACWNDECMGCDAGGSYSVFDDKGWFWSSSADIGSSYSWRINFDDGNIGAYDSATGHHFRCIKDESKCNDENKFCHSHDGLNWSDMASEEMTWDGAIGYCENLGGRLPTISELRTLVQNCLGTKTGGECKVADDCLSSNCDNDACGGCEYDTSGKYSVFGDINFFWSSSDLSDIKDASWLVHFSYGRVFPSIKNDNNINVRCVK